MGTTVHMNFADPPFAELANHCRTKPIEGYVGSGSPRLGLPHAWTLSVSNGSMTLFPATGLFFTPFHCGSGVRLAGPVKLTFSLIAPKRFERLQFRLKGSTGLASERVRVRIGSRPLMPVPEVSPGRVDKTYDVDLSLGAGERELLVESTAAEMNLVSLSWTYKGSRLRPFA